MVDSFLCRYGNQDIERVRNLSEFDRSMFFSALVKHLETEFSTPENRTTGSTESDIT